MNTKSKQLFILLSAISIIACNSQTPKPLPKMNTKDKIEKTEDEWKKILSPEQYHVVREKGTELPFSGKYYLHNDKGIYTCAACGTELFKSDTKFDAGCGWPSFFDAIDSAKINYIKDKSHGMIRTEITCAKCDGHLGHVFDDGPQPTGLRYCVNSLSIEFKK